MKATETDLIVPLPKVKLKYENKAKKKSSCKNNAAFLVTIIFFSFWEQDNQKIYLCQSCYLA